LIEITTCWHFFLLNIYLFYLIFKISGYGSPEL